MPTRAAAAILARPSPRGDGHLPEAGEHACEDALHLERMGVADRVRDHHLVRAQGYAFLGDAIDEVFGNLALDGAAEAGRDAKAQRDRLLKPVLGTRGDDAGKIRHCFSRAAADIGLAMGLAGRDDIIHLAQARRKGGKGAARVRGQPGGEQTGKLKRSRCHLGGIGKDREAFEGDEGCYLDFRHPGGGFFPNPLELMSGRQIAPDQLQAIAQPDFPQICALTHGLILKFR